MHRPNVSREILHNGSKKKKKADVVFSLSVSEQRICIAQFVRRFQPAQFEKFRPIKGREYINYVMYDDLPMNLVEAD